MDVSSPRSCRGGALVAALVVLTSFAMPSGADSLDQITVQSQRDREKLKHDVNAFVATAIVQSRYDESLERWTYAPICPLVAGLNKEQGEFILARLSEIAKIAGAPLAPEKCKPNLFVIVSPDPEPTLKKLADRHNGEAFNYATGAQLKQFVGISRPIRVGTTLARRALTGSAWYLDFSIRDQFTRRNSQARMGRSRWSIRYPRNTARV